MKKVSVLTPCYNGAAFLPKFFSSIIEQNYSPLELVVVNDGSTDESESVILQYKAIFEEKGIEFKYLYQENGGQASAVALGLKQVTGEYLVWPDSDDFLLPNSIAKKVEYLENNPECGLVRSNGYVYNESDCDKPISRISKLDRAVGLKEFVEFSVPWCPGCYMVRMAAFDRANPNRFLANYRIGQNIQMLLPVAYYYRCEYIDENLFGYVVHKGSHSHSKETYESKQEKLGNLKKCVADTLAIIPEDTSEYMKLHESFIRKRLYENAWIYGKKAEQQEFSEQLKAHGEYGLPEKIKKHFRPSKAIDFLLRAHGYLKRKVFKRGK